MKWRALACLCEVTEIPFTLFAPEKHFSFGTLGRSWSWSLSPYNWSPHHGTKENNLGIIHEEKVIPSERNLRWSLLELFQRDISLAASQRTSPDDAAGCTDSWECPGIAWVAPLPKYLPHLTRATLRGPFWSVLDTWEPWAFQRILTNRMLLVRRRAVNACWG